jgi:hypothetical protein
MAQGAFLVITDFLVYILPLPIIWTVVMPRRQRLGLLSVSICGLFVCVCGIMRTYYIHVINYETYDFTWEGYNFWVWSSLALNFGLLGGSIPSLKPILFGGISVAPSPGKGRTLGSTSGFQELSGSHDQQQRGDSLKGPASRPQIKIPYRPPMAESSSRATRRSRSPFTGDQRPPLLTPEAMDTARSKSTPSGPWEAPSDWGVPEDSSGRARMDRKLSMPAKPGGYRMPSPLLDDCSP